MRIGGSMLPRTRYMKKAGPEFIDLADIPRAAREGLYFEHDGHLNEAGQGRPAELLMARLDPGRDAAVGN
jgi:hypothetical protein